MLAQDYESPAVERAIKERFAQRLGVSISAVTMTVVSGSVIITVEVTVVGADAASAGQQSLESTLATSAAIDVFLSGTGAMSALSGATVTEAAEPVPPAGGSSGGAGMGAAIGGAGTPLCDRTALAAWPWQSCCV